MATLRVKARTKPGDELAKQDPATLSSASPAREKGPAQQAVDEVPASSTVSGSI